MNYGRLAWIGGGVILASVLDLVYMFWSRSATGSRFNSSVWTATGMGRGKFNVMRGVEHFTRGPR